ncbi:uncharacterized protein LOC121366750 [Gigantopelta aegis]|uniref:uncharacterized protein LOC121366750 n=1 Tax=Gigantopelta aegis TaxID=1735272 RepID=UPI001B8882FE|nr:uncharacterized protein LOC121366750 [Gigantopelta aegis]
MRSRSQASLGQIAPMVHSTSLHQTADATDSFQSATKTSGSFHDSSIPQSMDLPPSYEQVMSIPLQQPPAQTRLTPVHTQFTPVQAETNSVTKHDPLAFREPSIKAERPFASGVYERKLLPPRLPPLNLDGRNASDDYDKLQASSCRQTMSGDYDELQVPPKHSVLGVNRQNGLANVYSEIAADKIIGATPTTPRDYEKSQVSRKPAPHGAERQGTSGKNDKQELPANLPSLDAAAVQHAAENVYSEIDDDN